SIHGIENISNLTYILISIWYGLNMDRIYNTQFIHSKCYNYSLKVILVGQFLKLVINIFFKAIYTTRKHSIIVQVREIFIEFNFLVFRIWIACKKKAKKGKFQTTTSLVFHIFLSFLDRKSVV